MRSSKHRAQPQMPAAECMLLWGYVLTATCLIQGSPRTNCSNYVTDRSGRAAPFETLRESTDASVAADDLRLWRYWSPKYSLCLASVPMSNLIDLSVRGIHVEVARDQKLVKKHQTSPPKAGLPHELGSCLGGIKTCWFSGFRPQDSCSPLRHTLLCPAK